MDTGIRLFDRAQDLVSIKAGETIFQTGDERKFMYVVVDGEVDLFVNQVLVETVVRGGMFGEMALIEKAPRVATAVARTDCRLACIDEDRFKFMARETPFFALQVMRVLAQRLRQMNARIAGA
jgi:CRP/FNR family transcriptional regulator, cyclic AMP receptor protein